MTKTIVPKSDQLSADHLVGGPITITITRVTGNEGNAEQPVNVFYEGDGGKPYRPCKSMRRVMVFCWGANAATYVGKSMTLYRDPKVQWGGMEVGGIRISHMSDIKGMQQMSLVASNKARKAFKVEPLEIEPAKPREDKAAGVAAAIIQRVKDAMDTSEIEAVENDPKVIEQRAWLVKNRPELAAQVDAAFNNITEGAE